MRNRRKTIIAATGVILAMALAAGLFLTSGKDQSQPAKPAAGFRLLSPFHRRAGGRAGQGAGDLLLSSTSSGRPGPQRGRLTWTCCADSDGPRSPTPAPIPSCSR
jgi:hypothetical protein